MRVLPLVISYFKKNNLLGVVKQKFYMRVQFSPFGLKVKCGGNGRRNPNSFSLFSIDKQSELIKRLVANSLFIFAEMLDNGTRCVRRPAPHRRGSFFTNICLVGEFLFDFLIFTLTLHFPKVF